MKSMFRLLFTKRLKPKPIIPLLRLYLDDLNGPKIARQSDGAYF